MELSHLITGTAGVVGATVALLTYYRNRTPKRLIKIYTGVPVSVFGNGEQHYRGLHLLRFKLPRFEQIKAPYVTRISILNNGKASVTTENFDQGRPIRINLNARVVDILGILPRSIPMTSCRPGESWIDFGPELIRSRYVIGIIVLTDGEPDRPTVDTYHLVGAESEVNEGSLDTYTEDLLSPSWILVRIVVGVTLLAGALAYFFTHIFTYIVTRQ